MEQTYMKEQPILKLMLRMSLPMVISMMVNSLYNIVDSFFVAQISEDAMTALSLVYPVQNLVNAVTIGFGIGINAVIAFHLGAQDQKKADAAAAQGLVLNALHGVVLTAGCILIMPAFLRLFTSNETVISLGLTYSNIVFAFSIIIALGLAFEKIFQAVGKMAVSMAAMLAGCICNIILDPIFIFVLGMGVRGAALATILSQAVSAAWVVSFLCSRRSSLRLHRVFLIPNKRIIGRIAGLGVAPFIMQSTESLVTVVLNTGMQTYGGDLYVGSITIMQSIMQMIVMPVQGITQGTQPIMSYNYGAQNFRRVRKTFKRLLTITLSVTCAAFLFIALFPGLLARIFTPQPQLIDLVSRVMPLFFGGIWAFGAQMACQTTFMALGQARTSLFLALLRKVILLVPLALILPRVTGSVMGIYAAEPIADILASATTLTLFLSQRKKLLPTEKDAPKG